MPGRLGPWLRRFVDQTETPHPVSDRLCNLPACHFGIATTTGNNLRAHPRSVYENILATLSADELPEAVFYMEWAMSAVYGALGGGSLGGTTTTCAAIDAASCLRMACERDLLWSADGIENVRPQTADASPTVLETRPLTPAASPVKEWNPLEPLWFVTR